MKRSIFQLSLALCLGASTAVAIAADTRAAADPRSPTDPRSTTDTRPSDDVRAPLDRADRPRMERDNDNSRSVGTTIDDAAITAKVKTALFTDEVTKAWDINVDTMRSVVTLRGRVGSQAEADRAAKIADSTEGVSAVRNELEVGR